MYILELINDSMNSTDLRTSINVYILELINENISNTELHFLK